MNEIKPIQGFSKLSKLEKLDFLIENYFSGSLDKKNEFIKYWHHDESVQKTIDDFSENTISNFYFPMGVVPNVLINDKLYSIPMVIEESSVVAASSRSANFWLTRGGFHSEVISTTKVGQVHFISRMEKAKLFAFFDKIKNHLIENIKPIISNMVKRGGGITSLSLIDRTSDEEGYYQIYAEFETCDAMGANFINSVLEAIAKSFKDLIFISDDLSDADKDIEIIMSILSNYTPNCRVRTYVECRIEDLEDKSLGMSAEQFAYKFQEAIKISKIDVTRATTHNKGIFNGIDSVVIATGNDFRAVEACGHAYAARDGKYRGLSDVLVSEGKFKFILEMPIAIGTVGGLTSLHPMAKISLDMLGRPSANELMKIISTIGLAQNFAAIRSLVTSGIQKGHMKMHLMNILNHLEASELEREKAKTYFENEIISFKAVRDFIGSERQIPL